MNITFPMMFSNPLRNQRVVEEVYSKVPNNLLYAQFPTFFFQNLPMKIPHFFLHLKNEFYWLSFSWILLHIGTPFWRKSIELTFKVQKKWEIIIDNFWATFIPYACDEFSKSFFLGFDFKFRQQLWKTRVLVRSYATRIFALLFAELL